MTIELLILKQYDEIEQMDNFLKFDDWEIKWSTFQKQK